MCQMPKDVLQRPSMTPNSSSPLSPSSSSTPLSSPQLNQQNEQYQQSQVTKRVAFSPEANTVALTFASSEYDRSSAPMAQLSKRDIADFLQYRSQMQQDVAFYHKQLQYAQIAASYAQRKPSLSTMFASPSPCSSSCSPYTFAPGFFSHA